MIEHCVSSFSKSQKDLAYKIYVTNMLYRLDRRYYNDIIPTFYDTINDKKKKDDRTAEEIKQDIMTRINALSKEE